MNARLSASKSETPDAFTLTGATIIVASHELERAGKLATRTVDVVAGQVRDLPPLPGDTEVGDKQ